MQIGRLEKMDIRSVWPTEPGNFTPWLAEPQNLSMLANTLGLGDLTKVETEVAVGTFRADIRCKDAMDNTVLIENQFGRTDHQHLGQTLTYLVGSEAKCIIWIAEHIKEEHRAVVSWLNEVTPLDYAFFAVEIEVWRIGDSLPAPKFEIVVQPNQWERQQRAQTRKSDAEDTHRRIDYWNAFLDQMPDIEGLITPTRAPNQGWLKLPFTADFRLPSNAGVYLYRLVGQQRFGVYLSIGNHTPEVYDIWLQNTSAFRLPSLTNGQWERNSNGTCAYYVSADGNILDEADWPRQHQWMVEKSRAFVADWKGGLHREAMNLC